MLLITGVLYLPHKDLCVISYIGSTNKPIGTCIKTVFVLAEEGGMKIMEDNGQPSTIPSYSETYSTIPKILKQFALSK